MMTFPTEWKGRIVPACNDGRCRPMDQGLRQLEARFQAVPNAPELWDVLCMFAEVFYEILMYTDKYIYKWVYSCVYDIWHKCILYNYIYDIFIIFYYTVPYDRMCQVFVNGIRCEDAGTGIDSVTPGSSWCFCWLSGEFNPQLEGMFRGFMGQLFKTWGMNPFKMDVMLNQKLINPVNAKNHKVSIVALYFFTAIFGVHLPCSNTGAKLPSSKRLFGMASSCTELHLIA